MEIVSRNQLQNLGIEPKKGLGQNFLVDTAAAESRIAIHGGESPRAARQAIAVVRHVLGRPPLGVRLLARPRILRAGLWCARPLIPLPLETYLEAHFTKVGDQTAEMLDAYVAKGRAAGLPVDALAALATRLAAHRGAARQRN